MYTQEYLRKMDSGGDMNAKAYRRGEREREKCKQNVIHVELSGRFMMVKQSELDEAVSILRKS